MSDLKLSWKIQGEEQLSRKLKGLGGKVKNFKPEFKKSADFLSGFFSGEVFDSEGRAIGEKWPGGSGYHKLQRTGRMRRSFKTKSKKFSGEVYNAMDYFKYHQSSRPRGKLPRRVMMKLTNQLKDKIVGFFHTGVWKRVNKV